MTTAFPLQPISRSATRSATFGTASAVCAALTVLLPVVILLLLGAKAANEPNEKAREWAPLLVILVGGFLSLLASAITSVLGSVAGALALARRERSIWLAIVGLVVNGPLALLTISALAMLQVKGD